MQRTLAWGTSSKMILIQKLHVMGKTVAKIVWIKMLCSSICKMIVNEAEIHTCSPGILHFHLWPGVHLQQICEAQWPRGMVIRICQTH